MKYVNTNRNININNVIHKVVFFTLCIAICANMINLNMVSAKIFDNLPVSTTLDTFPISYQPYINALKAEHPNWIFKAVYTNLDWEQSVQHETYLLGSMGISTVHSSLGDEWKKDGLNYYQDGPYVTASRRAVEYVLDPRNSLTDKKIFQFETLSFSEKAHTIAAVEKILSGTDMGEAHKSEYKNAGKWINMGTTYANIIYNAAKDNKISPIHLATRIKQETSCNIVNNESINGSKSGYEGLYNFGNIGAVPGKDGNSAVTNGLIYARQQGWTTPTASIYGAAKELENGYIHWGQNTVYFQKFDVNNTGNAKGLYAFQYMTNIKAPTDEASISYNAYKNAEMLNNSIEFHIPVYNNMPQNACPYPTLNEDSYYEPDNTKIYLDDGVSNGNDIFNVRTSADDSSNDNIMLKWTETKEGAENRTILTRVQKGIGTNWDKIKFPDGREGYVSKRYVNVYNYTKVDSVTLDNTNINMEVGKTKKLNATINPTNAKYKDITWSSSDNSIVSVDNLGNIRANKLGTAKIKVTTNDQNKIAECTVNVQNLSVTGITLDSSEYKVVKDKTITILPTILPSNAANKAYTIEIADVSIAKVENSIIKGLKIGETTATFKTKDGNKTASCKIKVVSLDSIDVIIDGSLTVQNNVISKVEPGTKFEQLINKLTSANKIEIVNYKGEVLKTGNLVGTGSKINIKDTSNKIISTYTIKIYGDVNGDSIIDIIDLLSVKQHIENIEKLNDIYYSAAKVTKTNTDIDIIDLLSVKQHIENINKIIQ